MIRTPSLSPTCWHVSLSGSASLRAYPGRCRGQASRMSRFSLRRGIPFRMGRVPHDRSIAPHKSCSHGGNPSWHPIPLCSFWDDVETRSELQRLELSLDALRAEFGKRRGAGRNDLPVAAMWRAAVAGIVFQHASVESLLRKLNRNPALPDLCGFNPLPEWRSPGKREASGSRGDAALCDDLACIRRGSGPPSTSRSNAPGTSTAGGRAHPGGNFGPNHAEAAGICSKSARSVLSARIGGRRAILESAVHRQGSRGSGRR